MDLQDKAEEAATRILAKPVGKEVVRLVGEEEAVRILLRLAFKYGYRYEQAQAQLLEDAST